MAAQKDIEVKQKAGYRLVFTYKDRNGNVVNLTGWQAHMQVRASHEVEHVVSITEVNGPDGQIILGTTSGELFIKSSATDRITGKMMYDLYIWTDPEDKVCLLEGTIIGIRAITLPS